MKIKFLNAEYKTDKSWDDFFTPDKLDRLLNIEKLIRSKKFTPNKENVLRFTKVDLTRCKVVILGQDPYPQPGVATGRAFEVGNISDWSDKRVNASLRNILKLLHKNSSGSKTIPTIEKVRSDIKEGKLKILPPDELFGNWEKQGVLLLNTALTCDVDASNSHFNYWSGFTQEVVNYISADYPSVKWFLWGMNAQKFGSDIKSKKFECEHPQLNNTRKGSFYFENHFSKVKDINWLGK